MDDGFTADVHALGRELLTAAVEAQKKLDERQIANALLSAFMSYAAQLWASEEIAEILRGTADDLERRTKPSALN